MNTSKQSILYSQDTSSNMDLKKDELSIIRYIVDKAIADITKLEKNSKTDFNSIEDIKEELSKIKFSLSKKEQYITNLDNYSTTTLKTHKNDIAKLKEDIANLSNTIKCIDERLKMCDIKLTKNQIIKNQNSSNKIIITTKKRKLAEITDNIVPIIQSKHYGVCTIIQPNEPLLIQKTYYTKLSVVSIKKLVGVTNTFENHSMF